MCSGHGGIEGAQSILSRICAEQKGHDSEIMQGVDGEKAHALDVLFWVEKLNPAASLSLKLAALFHDIDRVVNPAMGGGFGGDRNSPAYALHKKKHAARSALYIIPVLQEHEFPEDVLEKTRFLILHHDDSGEEVALMKDRELTDLVTADSFAFFTSIAPRLLAAEGFERLTDKIAFMIDKLPDSARNALKQRKLDDDMLEEAKNEVLRRY